MDDLVRQQIIDAGRGHLVSEGPPMRIGEPDEPGAVEIIPLGKANEYTDDPGLD